MPNELVSELEEQWRALSKRVKAKGDRRKVFDDLIACYNEPHRTYHALAHVAHCLEEFEEVRDLAKDPNAIELALWFHDAVYDPHEEDNEAKSADYAKAACRSIGLADELAQKVRLLVLATKHGSELSEDPDARLIADIDLVSLAAPWEVFEKNTANIRKEYEFATDEEFRTGRAAFARMFLGRRIYGTEHFFEECEEKARRNLTRFLDTCS